MRSFIAIIFLFILTPNSLMLWGQNSINQHVCGFEKNEGQFLDSNGNTLNNVFYKANDNNTHIFLTSKGLSYYFIKTKNEPIKNIPGEHPEAPFFYEAEWCRIDLTLEGSKILASNIQAQNRIGDFYTNYILSTNKQFFHIYQYQKLLIENIYPNIDWVIYFNGSSGIKYDFIVKPGGNPQNIKMKYDGAEVTTLNKNGGYTLHAPLGDVSEGELKCYSNSNSVKAEYIYGDDNRISFSLGAYDKTKELIIDPPVVWSTFYGGNYGDYYSSANSITTDDNGNCFVYLGSGSTNKFNVNPGGGVYYQSNYKYPSSTAITKFNKKGARIWSTLFGDACTAGGITYDKMGHIYLSGTVAYAPTFATNPFPTKSSGYPGAYYQATNSSTSGSEQDLFVAKFDTLGKLTWCTMYGGVGAEWSRGIATDVVGDVYMFAATTGLAYPTFKPNATAHYSTTGDGLRDCSLLKLTSNSVLRWATYFGALNIIDDAYSIISDPTGKRIYISGYTYAYNYNMFPVKNAGNGAYWYAPASADYTNMFISEFDTSCTLKWSTMAGGTGWDIGHSMACDQSGNVYVAVECNSADFPSIAPTPAAFVQANNGGGPSSNVWGACMMEFDVNRKLVWSSYYGGNDNEYMYGVAVDNQGNIFYSGSTISTNLITLQQAGNPLYQSTFAGGYMDGFILQFDPQKQLQWATYLGGTDSDIQGWIQSDNTTGCTYMLGSTASTSGFFTKNLTGAYFQPSNGGGGDVSLLKVCPTFFAVPVKDTVSCNKGNDGEATITPQGGSSPFTYSWSGAASTQTTQTVTGLTAGIYTVVITDAIGLTTTATASVTEPAGITLSASTTTSTCNTSNGSATVIANGGASGFTYSWHNSGGQTTATATSLAAGDYTVTITDKNGCSKDTVATIKNANGPSATPTVLNATCYNTSDGKASVTVSGGQTPYTYSWQNGSTDTVANALANGTYTVQVNDANSCKVTYTVTISSPPPITSTLMNDTLLCATDSNGVVSLAATGGTSPYTYSWAHAGETQSTISNLAVGNYPVTITDKIFCTKTETLAVYAPPTISGSAQATTTLLNQSTGTIQLNTSGGTSPYTYSWSASGTVLSQTGSTLTNLPEGWYTVVITDQHGCSIMDSIQILSELPCSEPYIPTAFSPNNDGINDVFLVRGKCITEFLLQVFNRWGEKVFETNDITIGWNGIYRGMLEDSGVFIYIVTGKTSKGEKIDKKGNVTLVR